MDHTSVKLVQQTRYPWDGAVKMTVTPRQSGDFTIHVRIPDWARNAAVPTDLYRFADRNDESVILKVNGKLVPIRLEKGYVALNRRWNEGDVIELYLPMPIRRVIANPAVEADRGRIALQRGPIVFCAEWPGHSGRPRAQLDAASQRHPDRRVPAGAVQRRRQDHGPCHELGLRRRLIPVSTGICQTLTNLRYACFGNQLFGWDQFVRL